MHSYGGLVGSEAIPEELCYVWRRIRGLEGGVLLLFYYAAYILEEGQSMLETFGKSPHLAVAVSLAHKFKKTHSRVAQADGTFTIKDSAKIFYNGLPVPGAAEWSTRIVPHSGKVLTTKLTRAAYRCIPSTYFICEDDQAIPPELQETFAKTAKASTYRCRADHSPMLSQPDILAERIAIAVKKACQEWTELAYQELVEGADQDLISETTPEIVEAADRDLVVETTNETVKEAGEESNACNPS